MLPRAHPATVLAYVWTWVAIRSARRGYEGGHQTVRVPKPPRLPEGARRGMLAALRRSGERCLVDARVRQAWEEAHGRERALVIGVTAPSTGFRAHAWLDGDPPCCSHGFSELMRR